MPVTYHNKLIDRFGYAMSICEKKSVLDIGGQHPLNHDLTHPFGIAYRKIVQNASQYECFDRDKKDNVKYAGDLNTTEGMKYLSETLDDYQPQVVLCMEVLEHLNHPHAVMNIIAQYLKGKSNVEMFITIPNNANWILNALNWHQDHNVAFFKSIAQRFVERSELGEFPITMRPCMQKYKWYWRIIFNLAFRQPFNWGFYISKGITEAPFT